MKKIETEILVIGGGATGTGIAWDAALRGYQVILVERRDLTHGTTGRYHGLLHSGGRYVVKDPRSAVECIAENRILRKTHAHCIEDTGGFFVVTPEDEGAYPDQFVAACAATGVPCTEISLKEALRREPLLNPRISRVFQVPDGAADSFLAAHATAQAARMAGAQILTYHEVQGLILQGGEGDKRVVGARVWDAAQDEEVEIHAQLVISATGAWANVVAHMAGIDLSVIPGKGTMVAMNHRMLNTVINRCKMPDDGDIIVPIHTVAVIGTTDQRVADPENLRIDSWEIQYMLEEGDKMIPGISQARVVRAWAGVRPLYQEDFAGSSRDATRQFALLDHKARHNVAGLITITGGKWTTFRLMAEKTVDMAASPSHLGARQACITAHTPVPGVEQGHYWLGHRLHEVEEIHAQGQLVCECELVTRAMLENAARHNPTLTLDDLRRDVRLGMGPCQGGFCTYRAVGILHEIDHADTSAVQEFAAHSSAWDVAVMQSPKLSVASTATLPQERDEHRAEIFNPNLLLRDFLQERWKGVSPILWGQQLKQERLDELIYLTIMNVDHVPDAELTSPVTEFYRFDTTPNDKLEAPHD